MNFIPDPSFDFRVAYHLGAAKSAAIGVSTHFRDLFKRIHPLELTLKYLSIRGA